MMTMLRIIMMMKTMVMMTLLMMMTYFRNHLGASECLKKVKDEEAWNFKVMLAMVMTTTTMNHCR